MIAEINIIKRVCKGDFTKIDNYLKAINDNRHIWHLHHKLGLNHKTKDLKENDLYYHRPPEELEFLPPDNSEIIDVYDDIKSHGATHQDTKRRIESEFEFQSYINKVSREQCKDNDVIENNEQFKDWVEALLRYDMMKFRFDIDSLNAHTGLSKKFLIDLLGES